MSGLHIKHKHGINPIKWTIILIVLAVISYSGFYGYRWFMTGELPPLGVVKATSLGLPKVDEKPITSGDAMTHAVASNEPRFISIDSIGLNAARVFGLGLTKNNLLEKPSNIHDVAWYTKSATPGKGYGAVLLSAYSSGYPTKGAFTKIETLKSGDTISIERGDGSSYAYSVVSNDTISIEQFYKSGMRDVMKSPVESKEGLSLVAPAGNYIPRIGQFDERIIVRAVAR